MAGYLASFKGVACETRGGLMYYLRSGLGTLTDDLAAAIKRFEGTCPSPDSCRNNNPGNLRAGPGAVGTDSRGIAIFPDYTTGWNALEHQVDLNVGRGLSLSEFFGGKPGVYPGYAPAGDRNNPSGYANTVAGWLGIDPYAPLQSVSMDSGSPVPSEDFGSPEGAELSGAAIAGLGIAALAGLWAVLS